MAAMTVSAMAQPPALAPPPVTVNVMNVCTPSPGAQKGIAATPATASWVGRRLDFSAATVFSNVQHSFPAGSGNMVETLVLEVRDPKNWPQLRAEDNSPAVTNTAAMLGAATPLSRTRLGRFGKPSLARYMASQTGPGPGQSSHELLFQDGPSVMDRYRTLLQARRKIPEDLAKGLALVKSKASYRRKSRS